ncbi:hypothetical protein BC830DRAFT_1085288 [Chytriomyces sp. MP71]|nr:hypothetical protein BC830DRAFT_1085288 [Chytriomyces sp. MP71]
MECWNLIGPGQNLPENASDSMPTISLRRRAQDNNTGTSISTVISFIAAGIIALELFALILYILVAEIYQRRKAFTIKAFFTPANTLLFVGLAALFTMHILNVFYSSDESSPVLAALIQFCLGTIELSYTFFSTERSQLIVATLYPHRANLLKRVLAAAPLLYYTQALPYIVIVFLAGNTRAIEICAKIGQACTNLAGVYLILLDGTLLLCFAAFVRISRETGLANRNLEQVARYGIGASVFFVLSIALLMMAFVEFKDAGRRQLLKTIAMCVVDLALMTLFAMKVAVNRLERLEALEALEKTKASEHTTKPRKN